MNLLEVPRNKKLLQMFMSEFSAATDLATVLVDINGKELSRYHNFTEFCSILRSKPEYRHLCQKCDLMGGLESSKRGQTVYYRCHAGLFDFSLPIVIYNQLAGFILCGQIVVTDIEEDTEFIDKTKTNWNTYIELQRAYDKVKRISKPKLDASISLLGKISTYYLTKEMGSEIISQVKSDAFTIPLIGSDKRNLNNNKNEIKKALAYIDKNLHKNIQLEEIADHVYLSHYYFSKLFKKEMNVNFITYVNQKKIERAKVFLIDSKWSVEHIARNLGFNQTSYFCKIFKNFTGFTPAEFREQSRNPVTCSCAAT